MFSEDKLLKNKEGGKNEKPQSHEDLMREKFTQEVDSSISYHEQEIEAFTTAMEKINSNEDVQKLLQEAKSNAEAEMKLQKLLKSEDIGDNSTHLNSNYIFEALKKNEFEGEIVQMSENAKKHYEENKEEIVVKKLVNIERNKKAAIEKGGSETEEAFKNYEAYRLSGKDNIANYIKEDLELEEETDEFNNKFEELAKTHSYYLDFIEKPEWSDSAVDRFPDYRNYKKGDYLEEPEKK